MVRIKLCTIISTAALLLLSLSNVTSAAKNQFAVMGLDLGSEYFKVAFVKPGVPMEIAENGESRRKTPTVLTLKGEDTLTGDAALKTGIKFPDNSYRYMLELLGKEFDNPAIKNFQELFPDKKIFADPVDNTVVFEHTDKETYPNGITIEQIMALLLKNAKDIASTFSETNVKDAVITVPVYMNQNERKRLIFVAEEMVGLKVTELINSNAAIALNYGMFKRKDFVDKAKTMLIYDMGASRSTCSVMEIKVDEKTKDPVATVLGVGWDRTLGGVRFDLRIQKLLKERFEEKNPKLAPVTKPRALAKLQLEAQRVRHILSANQETLARIENLTGDDIDLKVPVNRAEIEELCADLIERTMAPCEKAIAMAGVSKEVVNEILLFGGLTRTPKIKENMENAGFTLLSSINTDEAAAIGASYRAADLSSAFRVKPFTLKNASPVQIQVEFDREVIDEDTGEARVKHSKRVLFGVGGTYPQKKILTFNRYTEDFTFEVNYGDVQDYTHLTTDEDVFKYQDKKLMDIKVTGVSDVLNNNHAKTSKGIKVHFKLDESGVFSYSKIESLFEEEQLIPEEPKKEEEEKEAEEKKDEKDGKKKPDINFKFDDNLKDIDLSDFKDFDFSDPSKMDPSMMDKLKSKFGNFNFGFGKDKKENSDDENSSEEKTEESSEEPKSEESSNEEKPEAGSEENSEKEGESAEENKEPEKPAEPKYKKVKSSVSLGSTHEFVKLINTDEEKIKIQVALLKQLEDRELEKRAREEAVNRLESFIYDKQDKLHEEGGYSETVSSDDKEKFSAALSAAADFIWDVEEPTAKIFNDKTDELTSMMKEWVARAEEMRYRPKLMKDLEDHFNTTKHFIAAIKDTHGKQPEDDRTFTDKEIETLEEKYNEVVDWKNSTVKKQDELSALEEPVITVKIVAEKSKSLDREASYLAKKARSWRPKPKKEEKKEEEKKTEGETKEEEKKDSTSEETASENKVPEKEEHNENSEGEQQDQKSESEEDKEAPTVSHEEL